MWSNKTLFPLVHVLAPSSGWHAVESEQHTRRAGAGGAKTRSDARVLLLGAGRAQRVARVARALKQPTAEELSFA